MKLYTEKSCSSWDLGISRNEKGNKKMHKPRFIVYSSVRFFEHFRSLRDMALTNVKHLLLLEQRMRSSKKMNGRFHLPHSLRFSQRRCTVSCCSYYLTHAYYPYQGVLRSRYLLVNSPLSTYCSNNRKRMGLCVKGE